MVPTFTWKQPEPWYARNDSYASDIRTALWKAVSLFGFDNLEPGVTTFTIYGIIFTYEAIEPNEQVWLTDQYGRTWTIPTWPWASKGA